MHLDPDFHAASAAAWPHADKSRPICASVRGWHVGGKPLGGLLTPLRRCPQPMDECLHVSILRFTTAWSGAWNSHTEPHPQISTPASANQLANVPCALGAHARLSTPCLWGGGNSTLAARQPGTPRKIVAHPIQTQCCK